jgi:hypothetical protein
MTTFQNKMIPNNELIDNFAKKYKELELTYKATVIDKYLEMKVLQRVKNAQIEAEIKLPMKVIKKYCKDLGYIPTRKQQHYTPQKRMDMSVKMKIAHRYKKELKEELAKADSMRNNISADEYSRLVNEIKNKYSEHINISKVENNIQEQETEEQQNEREVIRNKKKRNADNIRAGNSNFKIPDEFLPNQNIEPTDEEINKLMESSRNRLSNIKIPTQ